MWNAATVPVWVHRTPRLTSASATSPATNERSRFPAPLVRSPLAGVPGTVMSGQFHEFDVHAPAVQVAPVQVAPVHVAPVHVAPVHVAPVQVAPEAVVLAGAASTEPGVAGMVAEAVCQCWGRFSVAALKTQFMLSWPLPSWPTFPIHVVWTARVAFTWSGVIPGRCPMISAAAPEVIAAASDVPLPRISEELMLPGPLPYWLSIAEPGTRSPTTWVPTVAKSGLRVPSPWSEKLAATSSPLEVLEPPSRAATAMTYGSFAGAVIPILPSLPEAVTTVTPDRQAASAATSRGSRV